MASVVYSRLNDTFGMGFLCIESISLLILKP